MTNQKSNELAVKEPHDVFKLFDELDDRVIIAELEHKVVDTWIYHFIQDGKDIWGIGKAGIDGCSDMLGKKGIALREDFVKCEQDPTNPEFVLFSASVTRYLISKDGATEVKVNSAIGTKRQWIMVKRRDGHLISNKFWYEQGTIKALRNAKARLIDDSTKAMIIAYAKKHKKVKTIEMTGTAKEVEEKSSPAPEKKQEPEKPVQQKKSETISQKTLWAGEKKEDPPKEEPFEKATQEQLIRVTRSMATLVDKCGISPDVMIDKLEEKFGVSDLNKLSSEMAIEIAEFLEETIRLNESKAAEK